jgi:predicted lipid carrier protein YhbT
MEKYAIFSGLKGFSIANLQCGDEDVGMVRKIQKGEVGELAKVGKSLSFEIESQDLWLDMRVECREISLLILFEVKVDKNLSCGELKANLLAIINRILLAKTIFLQYEDTDVKIIKGKLTEEVAIVKDLRSSAQERKSIPKKLFEIPENAYIGTQFDYLDRFVICTICRGQSEGDKNFFLRRVTINSNTSDIVTSAFESVKENLPCRGFKIESLSFSKNVEAKMHNGKTEETVNKKCCSCRII